VQGEIRRHRRGRSQGLEAATEGEFDFRRDFADAKDSSRVMLRRTMTSSLKRISHADRREAAAYRI
jgi:hypothetical protein